MKNGFHAISQMTYDMAQNEKIEKPKRQKRVSQKDAQIAEVRRKREYLLDDIRLKRDIGEVWE